MSPEAAQSKASSAPHLHLGDVRGRSRPGPAAPRICRFGCFGVKVHIFIFLASGFRV